MLPKHKRLGADEVRRVRRHGLRKRHELFTLHKEPSERFGAAVVVSKKVASQATERNRIRRRVYAALGAHAPETGHYVFILSPAARKASFEDLVAACVSMLT